MTPRRWAGPFLLCVLGIALLAWSWGTWCDVLIDFGVQLYVPWQLAAGHVLYRDIAHYTGPLPVYYNAAVFRLLGPSLRTLVLANLPVLIGIVALVYVLARRLAGELTATVCGVVLLTLFAFAHVAVYGCNLVCPYEYDYTHGTLLCLAGMWAVVRWLETQRTRYAALAGLMAGLTFLTRAEFFVAIAAAIGVGLLAGNRLGGHKPTAMAKIWGAVLAAAAVPPALAVALLALAMPLAAALRGTAGMWPALLGSSVASQQIYRHSMGTDHTVLSLLAVGQWTGVYLAAVGFLVMAALAAPRWNWVPVLMLVLGMIAGTWHWVPPKSLLEPAKPAQSWVTDEFRPLPVVALAVLLWAAGMILRHRRRGPNPRLILAMMWATLSLVLLAKVLLYARISNYGNLLTMPAIMLLVILSVGWLPAWVQARGGRGVVLLCGMLGLWTATIYIHLCISQVTMNKLTVAMGSGGDAFRADAGRGIATAEAVGVAEYLPDHATLACLPEGIMINYLARRRTSVPYVNFNPPDLRLFGEDRMLAAFAANPPDYIMIVHKDTSEFGLPRFGTDYGQNLMAWIKANYEPMEPLLGSEPLVSDKFGIRVMARRGPGP